MKGMSRHQESILTELVKKGTQDEFTPDTLSEFLAACSFLLEDIKKEITHNRKLAGRS